MAAVFVLVAASFILPDPASAAASFDQSRDISSLPYLGEFEFGMHDVKGHVYQVSHTPKPGTYGFFKNGFCSDQ